MTDTIKITTEISISRERISDLLCTAFEGGSNYWIQNIRYTMPESPSYKPKFENGDVYPKYTWVPLNEGGIVHICHDDSEWNNLTIVHIKAGMNLMASEYPHSWQDFMAVNADAGTGDVFLQLCIFGEVVYS